MRGGSTGVASSSVSLIAELCDSTIEILSPNVCRALSDRELDVKRKGAKEVEKIIIFYQDQTDISLATEKTNLIIKLLVKDFLNSQTRDIRIGGLLALFCVAIGLQTARANLSLFLPAIIRPVIDSYQRANDIVIKYYTAECLYNLALTAPLEVSRHIEDLFSIDCQLWSETHANLVKAAECTDGALLSLADRHDLGSPKLFDLISQELNKPSLTPKTWLLKWIHHCINLFLNKKFKADFYKHALGVFRMAGFKLDTDTQSLLNKTVSRIAAICIPASASEWLEDFSTALSEILTPTASPSSSSNTVQQAHTVELFLNALMSSDREKERTEISTHLGFLIRNTFTLMRITGSNASAIMQQWLDFALEERSKEGSQVTNAVYKEMSRMLKYEYNILSENVDVLNRVKDWLSYLQEVSPSERKEWHFEFESLVKLTGDSREEIGRCAGECVGILTSLETSFVQVLLKCAVERVAAAETERQADAAIKLIRNLSVDSETEAENLIAALHDLSVTNLSEAYTAQIAEIILLVSLGLLRGRNSPLLHKNFWLARQRKPDSWLASKLVATDKYEPRHRTPFAWLAIQAEALVHLLELAECSNTRLQLGGSFYREVQSILPCGSKAYAVAEARSKLFGHGEKDAFYWPFDVEVVDTASLESAKARIADILLPAITRRARQATLWTSDETVSHKQDTHAVAEVICQPTATPPSVRKLTAQSTHMPEAESPPRDVEGHEVTVDREGAKDARAASSKVETLAVVEANRSVDDAAKHDVSRMTTATPNSPLA